MNKKIEMFDDKQLITMQFNNIVEFVNYIDNSPTNDVFSKVDELSSKTDNYSFTGTHSYDEALSLLKNGWNDMAKEIQHDFNSSKLHIQNKNVYKQVHDVVGYQPIVPLYLQGVQQNMLNSKMVSLPKKILTITKCISVRNDIGVNEIKQGSIKALQIINNLELQGYKVNLNVVSCSEVSNQIVSCKIKIKNANERLNISKLAFPLVHPSMHRRLVFRFREVLPEIDKKFTRGYGYSLTYDRLKRLYKDEIVLPLIINGNVNEIKSLEQIKAEF